MQDVRELIDESEQLLSLAAQIQDETKPLKERQSQLKELHDFYHHWYYTALGLFELAGQSEEKQKFIQEYEGGTFSNKIIEFLTSGLEINPFYDSDKANPLVNRWRCPFHLCFRKPLLKQRSLLASLGAVLSTRLPRDHDPEGSTWSKLEIILARFHQVARQLQQRHDSRPTLDITDEYDVQDLLHALLRIFFDDIREEEWTPSCAGGTSRVDFLLKPEKLFVEVKKARKSLSTKEIGDQLIIDIAHYQAHPDCQSLVCFVYDPDGYIKNATGLENDLSKRHGDLLVRVYVVPKG